MPIGENEFIAALRITNRTDGFKNTIDQLRQTPLSSVFDRKKVICGFVLWNIIGDDSNAFFGVHMILSDEGSLEEKTKQDLITSSRSEILGLIESEIAVPEIPDPIRNLLAELREKINGNWQSAEDFRKAYTSWEKTRKLIDQNIEETPELQDNINHSRRYLATLNQTHSEPTSE